MKKKIVTQSEFARIKGVSPQRVFQWVQEGIITLTPDRKVDVEMATRQLACNLDLIRRYDWEQSFKKRR
jgi:DNA-binding transcriptional regulator YdaS (Cro superfamily)